MLQKVYYTISSCFFIGNIKGGGTIVSLVYVLCAYFFRLSETQVYWTFALLLVFSAFSIEFSKSFCGDDRRIVSDELLGAIVSTIFFTRSLFVYLAAVAAFRFFDIVKPFPINRIERIGGATGIIMDDLFSGVAANALVRLI
ncbi:MAG: phosphatidylglycerophosphatase A, partial [bacterium]|nr:phosphatidylglycerophosphatase A [bacterium]